MQNGLRTSDLLADILSQWATVEFKRVFAGAGVDIPPATVTVATNLQFGDYQCNDAMSLAKVLKKPPRAVAEAFTSGAVLHPAVERLGVAGPGFINIVLKTDELAGYLCAMADDKFIGVPRRGDSRTVVIDYSSPNVAKPMHIAHIRSTIIGNAIDRMYRFLGYRVIADNHIGDWGTQFGILIMGYRHFANKEALEVSPVDELQRIYVASYEKTEKDEAWLVQCRQELVKLQEGDPANRALWKEFVDLSLREFQKIYDRLGVLFDLVRGESFYNDRLMGIVDQLKQKGLAKESEGATVVFLEEEKLPVCIIRKSDGGFNYATSDLATVISRVNEFSPEKIIYVTDERQQLHFRQFFSIVKKLGYTTKLEHIWFGLMRFADGLVASRKGNAIKLEKLLDEAEERALAIVQKTSPEMDPARQKEVARAVGIGAVKYADLSQNPQTTVTFTWEKALALDGNSGPYLQYAYARIASVMDKYAEKYPGVSPADFPLVITQPVERELALMLVRFPDVLCKAAESYKPSSLADYLYDLAQTYSAFYQNVPFLKAEEGVRESRIRLCGIVARVLKAGLNLLGIETPERI